MGATTGTGVGGREVTGQAPHRDVEGAVARRSDLVTAIAGFAFIALMVASFFTPETPLPDDPADQIASALTADRSGHQLSLLLGLLADVAFLVFLAGLWSRLRRAEGAGGMAAGLFGLAGAAFVAMILVSGGLYVALVQAAEVLDDPAALPALALLNDWVGAATVPAAVAMFLGFAAAVLLTRTLPVWLGWLGALTAIVLLVSVGGVFESASEEGALALFGFAGYLLFLIWALVTSIVLLMRVREPAGDRQAAA